MPTDQPRRAMTMREIREALGHKISEPTATPHAPTDWIDGHPQLDAIAAAVWEQCGRSDSGMCVEDDPRNIAVAALAAVLPPPVSRADEGVTPPPALTEEGRLRAQVEVLQQDAERDQGLAKVGARCMREGHQGLIESGRAVIEGHRFALSVALDLGTGAPWEAIHERVKELRRMAAEAQPDDTVHTCPGRWGGPNCRCFADEAQPGTEAPADVEHCVHDRAIHQHHHHTPVDGCPWCAASVEARS